MTDVLIREAEESDLLTIGKLALELVKAMDDTEDIDTKLIPENCRNLLSETGSHFLVAEVEGVVVGFVNFGTHKTILHRGLSGLINELIVAKSHHGKGIGRHLLSGAVEKCRQLGCCEVEVSTEETNAKAREFYKQCGFKKRGVLFEMEL